MYNTTVGWYVQKSVIQWTTYFIQVIEKIENEPGDFISWVCKNFRGKLADCFFKIIVKEIASIENKTLSNNLKTSTLTGNFGPMYINVDDFPSYTGAIYGFCETNNNAQNKLFMYSLCQIPDAKVWYVLARKVGKCRIFFLKILE